MAYFISFYQMFLINCLEVILSIHLVCVHLPRNIIIIISIMVVIIISIIVVYHLIHSYLSKL